MSKPGGFTRTPAGAARGRPAKAELPLPARAISRARVVEPLGPEAVVGPLVPVEAVNDERPFVVEYDGETPPGAWAEPPPDQVTGRRLGRPGHTAEVAGELYEGELVQLTNCSECSGARWWRGDPPAGLAPHCSRPECGQAWARRAAKRLLEQSVDLVVDESDD
jgi:hypothetical protein